MDNMKEKLKQIFIGESDSTVIQFIRYIFVGGAAFAADAGSLWLISLFAHYLIAAAAAFIIGLTVNFALSKMFVFTDDTHNKAAEFTVYGIIGVVGLGLTELLMYLFTEKLGLYFMLSKIITAAIVLIWNFAARKIILYRGDKK